jgi:tRNA(Arg) A34 adenosine deaminase TadA
MTKRPPANGKAQCHTSKGVKMANIEKEVVLRLPPWVDGVVGEYGGSVPEAENRMRLAIRLAAENVRQGTGGPFGAAVFESGSGRLVAAGVNLVVPGCCSAAHAEIIALSLGQRRVDTHDLGAAGLPALELVSSTEPCAMCLGAVPWSGVRRLVCGARGEDAMAVGFDEGAKPADWVRELESRGIAVVRDLLREEAAAVLRAYAASGGAIYNSRSSSW